MRARNLSGLCWSEMTVSWLGAGGLCFVADAEDKFRRVAPGRYVTLNSCRRPVRKRPHNC